MKRETVLKYCKYAEDNFSMGINLQKKTLTWGSNLTYYFLQAWNNDSGRQTNLQRQRIFHPAGETMNGTWDEKFDGLDVQSYFDHITKESMIAAIDTMREDVPALQEYTRKEIASVYVWNFYNNTLPRISQKNWEKLEFECDYIGLNVKPGGKLDKAGVDAYDAKKDVVVQMKNDLSAFMLGVGNIERHTRQMEDYRALAAQHKVFLFYDEKTDKFYDIDLKVVEKEF